MPTRKGAFKIFRLAGINVYLHWAWFLAYFWLTSRPQAYSSYGWNALEILSLFAIVLTHEFGHQLACRSVGGQTHDIILWPLGGVAYVTPPQRPGAQLWSIAAGPLVNVALIPVFAALRLVSWHLGWQDTHQDAYLLIYNIWVINLVLLIFNMMPIYPLDGGQILRSLLWFPFGRANSLLAASIIGFIGVAGFIGLAIYAQSLWLGLIAGFILMNCWSGFKQARALAKIAKIPRHDGLACPSCKTAPPLGEFWRCGKCGHAFDIFLAQGVCPQCRTQFNVTQCLDCGTSSPISEWSAEGGVRSAE
jgi:Zn-dependent protease